MSEVGPNQYRCAACRGVFDKGSDEEAAAEAETVFGVKDAPNDPGMAIVCDDCWEEMKWMWEGTPREVVN